MKYEMKKIEIDPFDIMCGDCPQHEIEYWVEVTESELREEHEYHIGADHSIPSWEKEVMMADGNWCPTPEDFNEWLQKEIRDGYIRKIA